MGLTENTYVKHIELFIGKGKAEVGHIFAEIVTDIEKDGAVVSSTIHRDVFDAASDEAKKLLGDVVADVKAGAQALLVRVQSSEQALDGSKAAITSLAGQLDHTTSALNDAIAQLDAATSRADLLQSTNLGLASKAGCCVRTCRGHDRCPRSA